MSRQGVSHTRGKKAVDGLMESLTSVIKGVVEIHISEVAMRKYKNGIPNGTLIFTLPDNTITGHINGVLKYILTIVYEENWLIIS